MNSDNLKEETLESKLFYKGSFFELYQDQVRLPNQRIAQRDYIQHSGACIVAPLMAKTLDSNSIFLFVRQYRYALKEILIEFPAGKIDPRENPQICAHRELLEETGYEAKKLQFLTQFYPCPGYSNESIHFYLAEIDPESEKKLYPQIDEFLEPLSMTFSEALELAEKGAMKDLKTIYTLYYLQNKIKQENFVPFSE